MADYSESKLLTRILELAALAVFPAFVFCWLSVFQVEGFYSDLFSHFQLQYFLVGLLGVIVFFLANWRFILVLSFFTMVGSLYQLSPYLKHSSTPIELDSPLKIATFNVHTYNNKYEQFKEIVKKEAPDFFAAIEVNTAWTKELRELNELYPHRHEIPRSDNFGIAVYSKYRFKIVSSLLENPSLPPIIVAKLKRNKKNVVIYAVHPLPPVRPMAYKLRNQLLSEVARIVKQSEEQAIVIGDLNTSMWSPTYKNFIKNSGLKDPRKRLGIIPTWPQTNPALYIPIEHILVSDKISVSTLRAIPIPGSDHKGLIAEVGI